MNKNQYIVLLVSGLCLQMQADPKVITTPSEKQVTTVKSVEATNNIGFKGRVKVVNGYEVAGNSTKGKKIREQFLNKKTKAEEELKKGQEGLVAANKEFTAKASTLSEKARKDEEKTLAKINRDLQERAQALKEELELDMYQRTEELGQDFEKTVQEYGKAQDLDFVADQSSGRLIYVAERLQCTDEIVKLMDLDTKKVTTIASNSSSKPVAAVKKAS